MVFAVVGCHGNVRRNQPVVSQNANHRYPQETSVLFTGNKRPAPEC